MSFDGAKAPNCGARFVDGALLVRAKTLFFLIPSYRKVMVRIPFKPEFFSGCFFNCLS